MNGEAGGGLRAADLIQIWIGIAISITAFFAWLTYRVTKGGFLLSVPHLSPQLSHDKGSLFVFLSLHGPGKDQWEIQTVAVASPRGVEFLERTTVPDEFGGGSWVVGGPIGRRSNYSGGPLVLSSYDRPVKLRAKLALKASPNLTSWRAVLIKRND